MFRFDNPHVDDYPTLVYQESVKRRICETCEDSRAKLIVFNNELKQDKPMFMWENWYQDIHIDSEGKQIFEDITTTQYFHE